MVSSCKEVTGQMGPLVSTVCSQPDGHIAVMCKRFTLVFFFFLAAHFIISEC